MMKYDNMTGRCYLATMLLIIYLVRSVCLLPAEYVMLKIDGGTSFG